ncbi:MAG: hypothetical protein WC901_02335 [Candidatus Margulisiibacteriota bacterium]
MLTSGITPIVSNAITGTPGAPGQLPVNSQRIEKAVQLMQAGHIKHAMRLLKAVLHSNPNLQDQINAYYLLAMLYFASGKSRQTAELAEKYLAALEKNPTNRNLRQQADIQFILAVSSSALQLAAMSRGDITATNQYMEEAYQHSHACLQLNPNQPECLAILGDIYSQYGNITADSADKKADKTQWYTLAKDNLQRAFALNPTLAANPYYQQSLATAQAYLSQPNQP